MTLRSKEGQARLSARLTRNYRCTCRLNNAPNFNAWSKPPARRRRSRAPARIALLAADGKDNQKIAAELQTSHMTVGHWRQRVLDLGLAGLQEAPRRPAPSLDSRDATARMPSVRTRQASDGFSIR